MSPEPQNVKECFHGSSQIVGKCHIICDFFWNISRWSAKTPKYQGSLNSPSLLTFKISLSDLQWILIVSRWVAKTPLVLGRFSRSSAKLQNFQINSTDYINAISSCLPSLWQTHHKVLLPRDLMLHGRVHFSVTYSKMSGIYIYIYCIYDLFMVEFTS